MSDTSGRAPEGGGAIECDPGVIVQQVAVTGKLDHKTLFRFRRQAGRFSQI